ncbi:Beta-glucosidase 44 [Ancistrocladus abbreviatus]
MLNQKKQQHLRSLQQQHTNGPVFGKALGGLGSLMQSKWLPIGRSGSITTQKAIHDWVPLHTNAFEKFEKIDDDCCNSCEEVREAYRKKGWAISNPDLIDQEDVELMEKLNFDAYRFSISWSRIFPDGAGRVNWKRVAYYNRLINFMLERGITPYTNLYHYDLPLALEKKYNGWLNHRVVEDFANYVDFCFKMFGDRVKNWMTMNEPKVIASCGYDSGIRAPGRCSKEYGNCAVGNSSTEPYIVGHNLLLSHEAAVQRYRQKYQGVQNGRIGILLDFGWNEPLTRGKEDNYAAQRACDFHLGWFLDPIIHGEYPRTMQEIVGDRLPKFMKEERLMVQGSIDLVGINQYTAYYMYNPPPQEKPQPFSYQQDWHVGFACKII